MWIGQKREREVILRDKLIVRFNTVFAHAQNDRIRFSDGVYRIAKPAGFLGTTRRVVFWIEVQDKRFSLVIGQGMLFSVAALQIKTRGLLSFENTHGNTSP
jgi:hypothetical protein